MAYHYKTSRNQALSCRSLPKISRQPQAKLPQTTCLKKLNAQKTEDFYLFSSGAGTPLEEKPKPEKLIKSLVIFFKRI
jgi:hypothetical protein